MQPALAQSVAETAAATLGARSDDLGGVYVSDEAIGAHFWFERGFRDHDELVSLINHTRRMLDERAPTRPARPPYRKPVQLSLELGVA